MNKKIPLQFKKVVDWLKSETGTDVVISNGTHYDAYNNRIIINYRYNLNKNGLYVLLHEAGHALQPKTKTGANLYKAIDDLKKPNHFRMYQFINEQDAWNKAIYIASILKLDINPRDFNKIKEESLLSYFLN